LGFLSPQSQQEPRTNLNLNSGGLSPSNLEDLRNSDSDSSLSSQESHPEPYLAPLGHKGISRSSMSIKEATEMEARDALHGPSVLKKSPATHSLSHFLEAEEENSEVVDNDLGS